MNMQKYYRLIADLRKTADMARARSTDAFIAELCSLKMKEAANESEKLLRRLKDLEDDRK